MSKGDIWMPFYIGDYLADTLDLSNAEHGAYVLAIFAYWRNRGPLTRNQLLAVCGKREFQRVARFFTIHNGLYHHKRIDKELQIAIARAASLTERALKGVEARRNLSLITMPNEKPQKPQQNGPLSS